MDLSVVIGTKKLANPVGVASGTFGYGGEYERLIDFRDIGALYTKAVTLLPREGNDIPRIVETPSGILNSIGLANVGVERFLSEKLPFCATLPCAIVVNVAGATQEEYASVVERCESSTSAPAIYGYEINVSCPNVKHGGMAFGTDPRLVESLTADLRRRTDRPLIVKLTPNVTDITVIARAAAAGGADALSCINTLVGMAIDVEAKRPVLPLKTGGLSGPAVRPVGVAAVYAVSRAVTIPVIGIGGIASGRDALEYLLAGAWAVQIGTANFVDPSTASRVLAAIREFAEREALTCVKDFHSFIR
jgi:dihydroorotate dehydrogenase (NAD+) catalytic subunit